MSPEDLVRILRDNPDLRRENGGLVSAPTCAVQSGAPRPPAPTEEQEQAAVIAWARASEGRWPELELLAAIPNGGKRDAVTGAMLKKSGVSAGIPDMILCCQRRGPDGRKYGALFVEMKRRDHSNNLSHAQARWVKRLREQGYLVVVAFGADEAIAAIERYLSLSFP